MRLTIHFIGRTGRFGRKGISINFVHDKRTWSQMETIELATGKKIIRIETNDLDEMEEVCGRGSRSPFEFLTQSSVFVANEEGTEVNHVSCTIIINSKCIPYSTRPSLCIFLSRWLNQPFISA